MALPVKETLRWKSPPPMPLHSLWPVLLPHSPVREDIPELATSYEKKKKRNKFPGSELHLFKGRISQIFQQDDATHSQQAVPAPSRSLSDLILFKGVRNHCACIKVDVPELIDIDQNSFFWRSLTV